MVRSARRPRRAGCARTACASRNVGLLICLVPALAAASCGAAGCPPGRIGGAGGTDSAGAGPAPAAVSPEPTINEREIIEYLRENPGDPSRAGLEQLLSTQAFSEDPERRRDYRPAGDSRSAGAFFRFTHGMISSSGAGRSDAYLAAEAGGWQALCRARKTESGGSAASWYVVGETPSGAVRLHAGALVPDYALGLVFGGSGGSSLSSGSFPFHAARRIAGRTSFFGQSLRGGAVEVRGGGVYAALFCGRPVTYGSDGPESAATASAGARIEGRRGRAEAGLSVSSGGGESGSRIVAVDGRWRSDEMNAGFEAGVSGSREPALLSAFSAGIANTRAGLFFYIVPAGAAGAFGSLIGRAPGNVTSLTGAAVAFERAFRERTRMRASFDRCERANGSQSTARQTARVEIERRGGSGLLRVVWSGAADERRNNVPYPAPAPTRLNVSRLLGVQGEWRPSARAGLGIALKRIDEDDGLGWLVAPVLRAHLLSERLRVTASVARYGTIFGNPVCYLYEPSLQGSFPLRVVSRDAVMGAMVIGLYISKLNVFARVAVERGRGADLSLQAVARL